MTNVSVDEESTKVAGDNAPSRFTLAQLPVDASLVDTSSEPVVGEGAVVGPVKRKSQPKEKSVEIETGTDVEIGPKPKKAKLLRAKHQRNRVRVQPMRQGAEQDEAVVVTTVNASFPTTSEMEQDVESLITSTRQQPFISEAVVPLDALVKEQAENDSFGVLCISLGSDGGMSELLMQDKVVEAKGVLALS
ncbi:hypothetical protein Dimus_002875 [Dionaea muscipula]